MVLSKSTKERNKTLMVMRFAYGIKSTKNKDDQRRQSTNDLPEKPGCDIGKQDNENCNRKRHSLRRNENGPEAQTAPVTNRTRLSITHASSISDTISNGGPPSDLETLSVKESSVLIHNGVGIDKNLSALSELGNGHQPRPEQCEDACDIVKDKKPASQNNMGVHSDKDSIADMIKEIESIPLVSVRKDSSNLEESPKVENTTTSKAPSPLLSRLSTESRTSNATSTSLLSNSSRKSLAEKIIERRSDLTLSISQCSSLTDNESVELPTVAGSSSCDASQCMSRASMRTTDICCEDLNGRKELHNFTKVKHSPDLIPTEGENSRPIVRRRRPRKILTAD